MRELGCRQMRYGGQVHTARDRPEGELPFASTKPTLLNLSLRHPCARTLGLPSLVLTKVSYSLEDVCKIPGGTTYIGSPLWNHLVWRPPRRILWPKRSHGHAVSPLFLTGVSAARMGEKCLRGEALSLSRTPGRRRRTALTGPWAALSEAGEARARPAHTRDGELRSSAELLMALEVLGSRILTQWGLKAPPLRWPLVVFNQTLVARASHLLMHSKRKH